MLLHLFVINSLSFRQGALITGVKILAKKSARTLISLALLLWPASSALAATIASQDAAAHFGQMATVTGRAFVTLTPSGEVYLDLDGQGDKAPLSAYVSRWNRPRFQNLSSLNGQIVEISGRIGVFRARPEIFLQDPGQILVK